MSIANIVLLELKIEVNELIKAASITDNIRPLKPTNMEEQNPIMCIWLICLAAFHNRRLKYLAASSE